MIVPATALSVLGGIFVQGLAPDALRVCFGVFLCLLSLCQFCSGLRSLRKMRGSRRKRAPDRHKPPSRPLQTQQNMVK